ncbi:putative lipid II flippase FtsW [Candidatus Riflebacteria bacterium]
MKFKESSKWDHVLLFMVIFLTLIGLVMIYSASSVASVYDFGDGSFWLKRQMIWALLGMFAIFLSMHFPYTKLKKITIPLLFISLFFLGLVLFPGVVREINGARRWLRLGPVGFQPSELAILSLIIFFARSLAERCSRIFTFQNETLKELSILGVFFYLILKQPNLSMALIICLVYFTMLIGAGTKKRILLLLALLGCLGSIYFTLSKPYRVRRIVSWWDLEKYKYKGGYHILQSLTGVGSGGISGLGFGNSKQKFLYLPESHTDFIFAIMAEELGFIGTSLVLFIFLLFVHRGLRIALRAPDRFGFFLALGLVSFIAFQILINIGVVLNMFPATGIPLPFISYGGSAYLMRAIAVGILLNISRKATVEREFKPIRLRENPVASCA